MAARDHNAALGVLKSPVREGGRGDCAQIDGAHAFMLQGLLDRLTEGPAAILDVIGGAGAEVVGIKKVVTGLDATFAELEGLEVTDFGKDVSIEFQLGQVDDFATATAGAEFEGLRCVGEVVAKGVRGGSGGHLRFTPNRDQDRWLCSSVDKDLVVVVKLPLNSIDIALSQKLLGNPELPSAPIGLTVIFSGISNSMLLTASNQLDLQLNTADLTMLGQLAIRCCYQYNV